MAGNLGPSIIGANRLVIHINHPSRQVKGQGRRVGGQGMGLRRMPMGAMGGSAVHGCPPRRCALGTPIEGSSILLQGFGLTRSGGLQLPWSKHMSWARTAISPSTMTRVASMMTEFRQPLQVQSHLEMPGILVQLGHIQCT